MVFLTFRDKEVFQSLFGKSTNQHDTSTKLKPKGQDWHSNNYTFLKCCFSDFIFCKLVFQMEVKLEEKPEEKIWMSTCRIGIYWLHLRLDTKPKYYTYTPYREA